MGNFNLKSIWKQTGGTGGSTNLEQRVQAIENGYFKKEGNALQVVRNTTDFYANVVLKQNGYVDHVDTNGPTSMINKRYLEEQTLSKTTTTPQTIASQITFSQTGEVLKIVPNSDTASYLSGYKSGNQRVWYFGKSSSSDNNLRVGADRGDIKLEPNGKVDLTNKKISFLADPTANQDAANKQYVDNRIKTRTLNQNIGVGTTFNIDPTSGYQIVSVMVARKRTSDNYYFFTHNINLNFQSFMKNNTQYAVYNNGSVNDFSNDFRIVIIEMKV